MEIQNPGRKGHGWFIAAPVLHCTPSAPLVYIYDQSPWTPCLPTDICQHLCCSLVSPVNLDPILPKKPHRFALTVQPPGRFPTSALHANLILQNHVKNLLGMTSVLKNHSVPVFSKDNARLNQDDTAN